MAISPSKLSKSPALHLQRGAILHRGPQRSGRKRGAKVLNVLIAEDWPIFALGLSEVISDHFNARIQLLQNARDSLAVCATRKFDLIIVGLGDPEQKSVISDIVRVCSNSPVLAVSLPSHHHRALRLPELEVAGYITKFTSSDELVSAIECLLRGGKYVSGQSVAQFARSIAQTRERKRYESLSPRERDIFLRFAAGKTAKEIAGDLSLSVKTISTHHGKIFWKLGVRTDAQLGEYAVRHGHIH